MGGSRKERNRRKLLASMANGTITAEQLGADRFDTIVACVALLGMPITIENDGERPGLEVVCGLARTNPRWARIVLDIVQGKREMPSDLDPPTDDSIAKTAWHIRAALIVAAAGEVPSMNADDRRTLSEILTVADDDYDEMLDRISAGCLSPQTKHATFVAPLRKLLDAYPQ